MGQQQREEERGEDLHVWPPALGMETAVPRLRGATAQHHHRCTWEMVTGDGHYDTRDGREQEQRGTEEDAEGGTVRHTQHCPNFQSCNLRNEQI